MSKINKWDDAIFMAVVYIILIFSGLVVAYPLIYAVSASFSSTQAVVSGRVILWPVDLSLYAYQVAFRNSMIMIGYRNSIFYTVLGTIFNLIMCTLCAYPLSRKRLLGRSFFSWMLIITMFFSGGLIPTYLVVSKLGMINTIWAMTLPGAMSAWYVILMRTYLTSSIPEELFESANIDGCGGIMALFAIVLPLSKPILAVIALYCAVGIWGSYFDAFIYLTNKDLFPLQIALRNILIVNQISDVSTIMDVKEMMVRQGLINVLRYAVIVMASVPPLMLYPFAQKHFLKGIMIGSLKG